MVALILFGLSEEVLFPLDMWHCTDIVKVVIGHTAVYVLPPEAILGPCVLFAHHLVLMGTGPGFGRFVARVVAAVLVMLVYLGALAVSFALLEVS